MDNAARGWYQIGDVSDLPSCGVMPLRCFGQDLVLWRAESGVPALGQAHCAHLGAHLGYGGKVLGETISCPFHGWRYGTDGHCVAVPYSQHAPPKVCLRQWPVTIVDDMLFAYQGPAGESPAWRLEPVDFWRPLSEWTAPIRREWRFHSTVEDIGENIPDGVHFRSVHQTASLPATEVHVDGHRFHAHARMKQHTPRGEVDAEIESWGWGLGRWVVRFTGIIETVFVTAPTPIERDEVQLRVTFRVREPSLSSLGRAMVEHVCHQIEQDIPIWEHKLRLARPVLMPEEAPVREYRRWLSSFE